MGTNEIGLNRDNDNDVLYVFDNRYDKSKTTNIHVDADILVRITGDHKVVGLTITDFSKSKLSFLRDFNDYKLMECFDVILNSLDSIHKSVEHGS